MANVRPFTTVTNHPASVGVTPESHHPAPVGVTLREELLAPGRPARRHLISIGDLSRDDVERVLALAREFARSLDRQVKKLPTLKGRTVVNLFYEPSTRTSSSFELAGKRLSADVMSIRAVGSSVDKGESLKDTALTIAAYDPDVIVIRHPEIGAPQLVARNTEAHIVNAGDGTHQHPTQALLDVYTIDEELGGVEGLHVAIVGDVLHSRVARSNIQAFLLMGARVTLVGPPPLIPRGIGAMGCEVSHDIETIRDADVVYVLRMQRERMLEGANYVPSLREYTARWGVTSERLRPGQKVMHPGPMNRGVEIDPVVADMADALIERQVRSGLVTRMAVLYDLLTHDPAGVRAGELEEVA
jgi:aspartate carbamoyltransferase catalytic subunit